MEFTVKYESSEGPHLVKLTLDEIQEMARTGSLTITKPVGHQGNRKTITITGTNTEFEAMSEALLNART
ncbi:MAG: hypothetical protein MI863_13375 [Desulfobacterales bacterium]|nr:hypothetical protein [Desulfobacterales bacterium]